ncbi:Alternative oxidase, mitochondrial precursor [Meristemomyces frigidus]|nr:Alternative oxidase, mitochondrial precursor [Meristemomyces frigidus]
MSKRISYKVEGDVQGVNYRSWAAGEAKKLNVTGYAKNANDGTVVGEAQGDASALDKFVQHLNMGPPAASVNKVDQKEIETKSGDSGFERRGIRATALSKQSATHILRSLNSTISASSAARPTFICLQAQCTAPRRRQFSSSRPALIKDFFPPPDAPNIRITEPAWAHPVYTYEQMEAVKVEHRNASNWSDYAAISAMRVLRWGLDLVTGYRHDKGHALDSITGRPKTLMTERKWLIRFVFLESVAGVPGMVAGMLRHLHSMRRMKRDNGWIESLLEESYNERMHLLTFLKLVEPGWFMRLMVLGAQGVFFNAMFVSYLISPRTCHRFVGYLEEEAVLTYTRAINDLDAGKLPKFEQMQAPDIAVKYWNMPEGHRTMRDLLLYVRADESKHREVNHTLGNLDQKNDPNPYVSTYKDEGKPHPVKDIKYQRPTGWEREEVIGTK